MIHVCTPKDRGKTFLIGVYVDDIVLAGESTERITQDDKVWLGQPTVTESILRKYRMEDAKPIKTPVNVNSKLLKATDDSELADQSLYQSAVGSLLYLTTRTRPDIAFAVNSCARFCSKPTNEHWTAVKRIFRYLRGTIQFGLVYTKGESAHSPCMSTCTAYQHTLHVNMYCMSTHIALQHA